MRRLLGVSDDDDTDYASYSSNNPNPYDDSTNPVMYAIEPVAKLLRMAEKNGQCIDDYFHHRHYLFACDGNGAYYITSLFTMAISPPGSPVLKAITNAVIRCHDNFRDSLFLPTQAQFSDQFFLDFLNEQKTSTSMDYKQVSYKFCAKLIMECLQRMKQSKKSLQGKEARTVARLFGLPTRDSFHQTLPSLPEPMPAPSVEALWITLHRPEYLFFTANEDLYNHLKVDAGVTRATETTVSQAMRFVAQDEYRRNRTYAMLEHMTYWHTVGGETEIASWLLWERAAMMNFNDEESAIRALECNVVFQVMISKFYDSGVGRRLATVFPSLDEYGRGLTNFMLFQDDLEERGTLPPGVIITASVAEPVSGSHDGPCTTTNEEESISRLSKYLERKAMVCAICGTTQRRDTAGSLFTCARCASVYYCCKEHQKLHWKNGHKQECMPR